MSRYKPTPNLAEIRPLIFKLNHGSEQQRCEAAKHIELLVAEGVPSARQALPSLIVALEDRSWAVRENAMRALAAFPPSPGVDRALTRAVRLTAAERKRTERDPHRSGTPIHSTAAVEADSATPRTEVQPSVVPALVSTINLTSQVDRFVSAVAPKYETVFAFLSTNGIDASELSKLTPESHAQLSNAIAARWCEQLPVLLDPRTAEVVIRRHGLNGESPLTLRELGQDYGVTRERIRQIEIKGIKNLKLARQRRALVESAVATAGAILGVPIIPPPQLHITALEPELPAPIHSMDTIAQPPRAKSYLVQSLLETQRLVTQGMALSEIMHARGVTEKTVYKHLALLIERGQICVEQVLPTEIIAQVQQAIGKRRRIPSLTVLKQRLPVTLSYGEIRCVIAARLHEAKNRSSKAADQSISQARM